MNGETQTPVSQHSWRSRSKIDNMNWLDDECLPRPTQPNVPDQTSEDKNERSPKTSQLHPNIKHRIQMKPKLE
jgi:hypothetical protein